MKRWLVGCAVGGAWAMGVACGGDADEAASSSGSGGSAASTRATTTGAGAPDASSTTAATGGGGTSSVSTGGGGTSSVTTGGGGSTGSAGGMPGAQPPPAGAATPGDGSGAVFAISRLYLPDQDPDGSPDKPNGWKNYGYDIDGLVTQCSGNACNMVTGLCAPAAGGAKSNVYPDGLAGRDNSFGINVYDGIILGVAADASMGINQAVQQGAWTLLIAVDGLGAGDSYNPLPSRIYTGAPLATPPNFDGNDVWPATNDSVTDPSDLTTATVQLPTSYVTANTWVSSPLTDVTVALPLQGFNFPLPMQHAVITFEMSADHSTAAHGMISGVIPTEAMVDAIATVAGTFDPSLCSGTTIDAIKNQIRQTSDIMQDGSPGAGQICDGISLGLGFDAVLVQIGGVAAPVNPPPDPCGP